MTENNSVNQETTTATAAAAAAARSIGKIEIYNEYLINLL